MGTGQCARGQGGAGPASRPTAAFKQQGAAAAPPAEGPEQLLLVCRGATPPPAGRAGEPGPEFTAAPGGGRRGGQAGNGLCAGRGVLGLLHHSARAAPAPSSPSGCGFSRPPFASKSPRLPIRPEPPVCWLRLCVITSRCVCCQAGGAVLVAPLPPPGGPGGPGRSSLTAVPTPHPTPPPRCTLVSRFVLPIGPRRLGIPLLPCEQVFCEVVGGWAVPRHYWARVAPASPPRPSPPTAAGRPVPCHREGLMATGSVAVPAPQSALSDPSRGEGRPGASLQPRVCPHQLLLTGSGLGRESALRV